MTTLMAVAMMEFVTVGQQATRFDEPIFTMDGAVLCPGQQQVTVIRRVLTTMTA